jgi:ribonuclease P protein component
MQRHTFRRAERLKSEKAIGLLFSGNSPSFAQYPMRLVWRQMDEKQGDAAVLFAMSVPKKRFKRAVTRNLLRRRIREAYRQHKYQLEEKLGSGELQYAWMIIFTGQEVDDYATIEKAMQAIIRRFLKKTRSTTEA